MTAEAAALAEALRERRTIIADDASRQDQVAHMERLRLISEKLEHLAAKLPQPVPEQLSHFLQRRSYDKALSFIENESES